LWQEKIKPKMLADIFAMLSRDFPVLKRTSRKMVLLANVFQHQFRERGGSFGKVEFCIKHFRNRQAKPGFFLELFDISYPSELGSECGQGFEVVPQVGVLYHEGGKVTAFQESKFIIRLALLAVSVIV